MQQYQANRSPVGASSSKNNNLLRNTFSLAVYQEFLNWKKNSKRKEAEKKSTEEQLQIAHEKIQ